MEMTMLPGFSGLTRKIVAAAPAGAAFLVLSLVCGAGTAALAQAALAQDEGATENTTPSPFVTFVVPTANQGTLPWTINANGDVAGVYVDPSDGSLIHSFVRSAAGVFSLFDVPGAAVPNGSGDPHGTVLFGIDAAGDAVGMFTKGTRVDHGFVRTKGGSFTTFDVPGAGTGRNQGTVPVAFDASGGTLGFYLAGNYLYHGFHRTAAGVVTEINDPNAGKAGSGGNAGDSDQGTNPAAINAAGTIVGRYTDANYAYHGFIRTAAGAYSSIDVAGAGSGFHEGTVAVSIDADGNVAGLFWGSDFVSHGFVRSGVTGAITTFSAPKAGAIFPAGGHDVFVGTAGLRISAGVVTGSYTDSNGLAHGFVRSATGVLSSFDVPGATAGAGFYEGSLAAGINPSGLIVGAYSDVASLSHGYLYTPVAAPETTTTTLAASPNPSVFQQPVTFTSHTTSANGAPPNGESITFLNGTKLLGTDVLSSGEAGYTTTALPVASSAITAQYAGDTNFASSTSTVLNQKVNPASTSTALASSANPSNFNQPVTFTATVTGQFGGTATGSVAFYYQFLPTNVVVPLGTVTLSAGKAAYSTATLSVGTSVITATYSGDSHFNAGSVKAVNQVVNKAATTTVLTSSANPSTSGHSVTLTATVTGKSGGTPAGSVIFNDGSTKLATVTLSAGKATYSTAALSKAQHSLTAVYSGSTSYLASTGSLTQKVN